MMPIDYSKINDINIKMEKLIGKILYLEDFNETMFDVYFLKAEAVPADISRVHGTSSAEAFAIALLDEIKLRNNVKDIWRFHHSAFGIIHNPQNCGGFKLIFAGYEKEIIKKTLKLEVGS